MMNLEKDKYYRYMFLIAAIWNFFVGMSLFLASVFLIDIIAPLFEMAIPPSLVWFHVVSGMVFFFGVGYYIVSRDISQNHGLVILGIIEKFFFFFAIVIYYFLGAYNFNAVLLVIVDLVFGCLFLEFLINYKKN